MHSDDTENTEGIPNFSCSIHLHFHPFTVFNEEMHLLRHIFRNMPNSFSVFIFTRNCIPIMYERQLFVFITGIQNFSKFRLPRVLKKVEPGNVRWDFKCFYNNLVTYVFNNDFNRWKYFVCFVLCIYHCTELIKYVSM